MRNSRTIGKFSSEMRARAVRMVHEHESECGSQWEAIRAIAPKIGCCVDSLRRWARAPEGSGSASGSSGRPEVQVPVDEAARIKALEQENRELRQANEILRKASAYFAQAELDRRFRP